MVYNLNKNHNNILAVLINNVSEGVILYDHAGNIIFSNKVAEQIAGNEAESLNGNNIKEVFPSIKCDQDTDRLEISIDEKKEKILEIKIIGLKGDNHSLLKAMVLKDITLMTKLKSDFKEIEDKNKSYEDILNSLDHGVQVVDEKGVVTFFNPVQAKLDGMKKEDVIGKHMTELYKLDDESSFLLKVLKTGQSIDDRQDYVTASGKLVNIISTAVPLYRENKIAGAVAITKDFDYMWEFFQKILALSAEIQGQQLKKQKRRLFSKSLYSLHDIIGKNPQLHNAKVLAQKAANSTAPVLIYGETGTGKELFAQSIHNASPRRDKPFIAINCAAIPENLLEGILFGTVPGAFTGAVDRPGLFEQASEGSVFLDEVNSMPLSLQAKLLRVIQEGVVRRVGGTKEYSIDIRIISSSNEKPLEAINNNKLRSDLFYRIGVMCISVPALKERIDDLPLLVDFFINKKNKELNKKVKCISPDLEYAFLKYNWPGNVRQLEHVIECAMNIINNESEISREHLPDYIRNEFLPVHTNIPEIKQTKTSSLPDELQTMEISRILAALKAVNGNVSKAAKNLSISRQCLQYRMKKFNINIDRNITNHTKEKHS